jgi:hypothetical protein
VTNRKNFETALTWLPSILVAIFFIRNAFEKIFQSDEISKLGLGTASIILVGVGLLVATALFLVQRTVIIGTVILAAYMAFVVVVHFIKGKPFVLTLVIVLVTVFAGYIRKTKGVAAK